MSKGAPADFVCPLCGADVPAKALSCPECGSDEKTGWSEETYLDNTGVPEEDDEDSKTTSGGVMGAGKWLWVFVAALLFAVSVLTLVPLRFSR